MLHSLSVLTDVAVLAADGESGRVIDFFFDDQSWGVRYLVVDPGSWLVRHHVLIGVTALGSPDWEKRLLPVHLTREQVRHSPDVDTDKPVSRQQEIAMTRYFGWPTHWSVRVPTGHLYTAEMEYPTNPGDNPHLRSAWAIAGYSVWGTGGEIGRIEDFVLDDTGWRLGYLMVKTGNWLNSQHLLVSTAGTRSISWANRRIDLARRQPLD